MEVFFQPVTRLCEIIWCATQVSGQSIEIIAFALFGTCLAGVMWHLLAWQKKLFVMLQAVQQQLHDTQAQLKEMQSNMQEGSFSQERVLAKMEDKFVAQTVAVMHSTHGHIDLLEKKLLEELYEQCHVLSQFFKPANLASSSAMVVQDVVQQIKELLIHDTGDGGMDDAKQVKIQLLEVLSKLTTLQSISTELTSVHKFLNAHDGDFGKLVGTFNTVTEIQGLLLQMNGDALTPKVLSENVERLKTGLERKVDDLAEKTAVIRALMDQRRDKTIAVVKDNTGWISKNLADTLSLLRTICPQQQKMLEMIGAGREASVTAQQTLLSCAETVQTCEDRLVRLESLSTGVVDQQNEMDQNHRQAFDYIMQELPAIQEILARLPKLPVRKPPAEKPAEQQSNSSASQQPTTPPTTLGPQPQPAATVSQPPQVAQPTVIPVSLDTSAPTAPQGGIQLRLSEHVGTLSPQPQPQFLLGGESRPNFLITQIPSSHTASGSDLLRAMLNPRQ